MHALPAAPPPPPQRQVLVGTALASAATLMLIGSMLAVWWVLRDRALAVDEGTWLPSGVTIPEVPANTMLIGLCGLLVFAHWAIYAVRRQDRAHGALALGLVAFVALAIVNAQAYVWNQMELPISEEGGYATMFYAVTGTMTALLVIGIVFTGVVAFRVLGGRSRDQELVVANTLYWYVLTAAFTAMWFVVYVTK